MADGTQAAALAQSKLGEPTSLNMCVHGIRTEILQPLGVPCPNTDLVSAFINSPLMTKVSDPMPGDIAHFPLPYFHVAMVTQVANGRVFEVSWGTTDGIVRGFWMDNSYFAGFYRPQYTAGVTATNTAAYSNTPTSLTDPFGNIVSTWNGFNNVASAITKRNFWIRSGVGALGVWLLAFGGYKILKSSGALASAKHAAETVALVAK